MKDTRIKNIFMGAHHNFLLKTNGELWYVLNVLKFKSQFVQKHCNRGFGYNRVKIHFYLFVGFNLLKQDFKVRTVGNRK